MIQIRASIETLSVRSELRRVLGLAKKPERMLRVVGRRGANEMKAHFRQRNTVPNKLGGRRTNYWRRVADSVQNPILVNQRTIEIAVSEPTFTERRIGGDWRNGGSFDITPKIKGALTVPIAPEAHGRTVKVFERETGIHLFRLKERDGGLSNALYGPDGRGIKIFYLLLGAVTQQPDANALPNRARFMAALLETAQSELDRETAAQ